MTKTISIYDIDDYDEVKTYLYSEIEKNYPDWPIQEGENWEVIAKIFYQAGRKDALK